MNKHHLGCNEHLLVHKTRNSDAFLGTELVEGGLVEFGGKFIEPKVFEELTEENEELTKRFSTSAKQKFPCQWD